MEDVGAIAIYLKEKTTFIVKMKIKEKDVLKEGIS
jgi:hypothetical protein